MHLREGGRRRPDLKPLTLTRPFSLYRPVRSGVRIRAVPAAEAETLQKGHGGINDTMKSQLGKEGVVGGFDSDGDVRVVCEDKM